MTDTGTPATHARSRPSTRNDTRTTARASSGWVGWLVFASCLMFLVACFQIIEGLVAIFDDEYYQVGSNGLVVHVSYTGWGWLHLVLGLVIGVSAAGVVVGNVLARTVGVLLAGLSAVLNLLFISAYPIWSLIIIAVDVLVIWALTVHGGELRDPAA